MTPGAHRRRRSPRGVYAVLAVLVLTMIAAAAAFALSGGVAQPMSTPAADHPTSLSPLPPKATPTTTPQPTSPPPPSRSTPPASTSPPTVTAPATALTPSRPVHVDIAAIGVDSRLVAVTLGSDGRLRGPANASLVGWYDKFPTPGQLGPALLVAHGATSPSGPAAFHRLGSVRPGDRITVTRADGIVVTFVVDDVRTYPPGKFPTSTVYGLADRPVLRLITFDGSPRAGTSIVVFSHLIASTPAR